MYTFGNTCRLEESRKSGKRIFLECVSIRLLGELCFEGNIDFYGKSGFDFASKYGIRYQGLPEGEDASFFLCKELIPGLETNEDLEEHKNTVLIFMSKESAICAKIKGKIVVALLQEHFIND